MDVDVQNLGFEYPTRGVKDWSLRQGAGGYDTTQKGWGDR